MTDLGIVCSKKRRTKRLAKRKILDEERYPESQVLSQTKERWYGERPKPGHIKQKDKQ